MIDGAHAPGTLYTLDEPIYATVWRDLKRVGFKLFHVLLPRGRGIPALRDCASTSFACTRCVCIKLTLLHIITGDLWGPLLLCLILASVLASEAPEAQAPLVFATVFVIVWVGAGVVTVNALLLGGTMYVNIV